MDDTAEETESDSNVSAEQHPDEEAEPEQVIVKAAILLFCLTPSKSCIALLLGKIREKQWVRSTVLHSDFGGRVEESDPDVEYTAAREYYEETLGGQVPLFGMQANDMTIDQIADCLRKKHYFAKITTTRRIRRPSKLSYRRPHTKSAQKIQVVTFLVRIPYLYTISVRFERKRRKLLAICKAYNEGRSEKPQPAPDPPDPLDPALELHEGRLRVKPCFDEIETLNMFSVDYTMRVCKEKLSHKRLSLLHNCRLRFKSVLELLLELQHKHKFRHPIRNPCGPVRPLFTASSAPSVSLNRYNASRQGLYLHDLDDQYNSEANKNSHNSHNSHSSNTQEFQRSNRSNRNYRWK